MNIVKEIIKGILIGIANIIPGVSGGTMAVSMGVYDKIISAITGFRKNLKKSILTLIPYIIGAAAGIGILSFVVNYTLSTYPLQTSGLFIGLIIGGLPILGKHIKGAKLTAGNIIVFVVFFCIVTGMAFISGSEGSATDITVNVSTVIQLFFVGIIASATMIIPGVSGSLVMMVLGFYGIIISSISNFITSLLHFDMPALIHGFGVLFPFGIGVLVGIGLVAKLIEILFAKVPVLTYCAIFGLIIGSPIAIIYKAGISYVSIWSVLVTVVTFGVGFAITFLLGKDENTESHS
jgi:putative membrane protein